MSARLPAKASAPCKICFTRARRRLSPRNPALQKAKLCSLGRQRAGPGSSDNPSGTQGHSGAQTHRRLYNRTEGSAKPRRPRDSGLTLGIACEKPVDTWRSVPAAKPAPWEPGTPQPAMACSNVATTGLLGLISCLLVVCDEVRSYHVRCLFIPAAPSAAITSGRVGTLALVMARACVCFPCRMANALQPFSFCQNPKGVRDHS
jgi:hypothetical protein